MSNEVGSWRAEDGSRSPTLAMLVISATGVVFGDIGTSPLYAIKECFSGPHALKLDEEHVFGILSLIFWSVILVVAVKYVTLLMRADNHGEGGSLALLALVRGAVSNKQKASVAAILGVFAAALFYGDSMITPAISVLSAVEGLSVVEPTLTPAVVPLTVTILVGLFLIQSRGTSRVGRLFGPIMCVWFISLAILGSMAIAREPHILAAVNPWYAWHFFALDPLVAFLALGSVVLVLTGAEALYTDMGHFGRRSIRVGWYVLILPSLLLNYFGQGALLLTDPSAVENPFYRLAPAWAIGPLIALATMAAVIASQAVISGAFSVTNQAIQLGYLPRMRILHTSAQARGQIYIPFVNGLLMVLVVTLVIGFQASTNLAAAYGVAVTGTMAIDTMLLILVMLELWRWKMWTVVAISSVLITVDLAFFLANAAKIPYGGWFPLVMGIGIFTLLTTWKRGRDILNECLHDSVMPIETCIQSLATSAVRVPGTAVFLTHAIGGAPSSLLHNLKHNKVLHERVVMLTVKTEPVPYVPSEQRVSVRDLGSGFHWITVCYGFMQRPNVPRALQHVEKLGFHIDMMDTSFFLSRETLISSVRPGMARWREKLFAWMTRNAASAMDFFKIPANRVIELGSQIEI